MDYTTLDALRQHHPAWRLLNSPHVPLIASFLHRVFNLLADIGTGIDHQFFSGE
jgi:hypothetical protein